MRRIATYGTLLLVALVLIVYRQRLFVRDPLARVERNGMRVHGAQVYFNYYNDILVQSPGAGGWLLVQAYNGKPMVPGVPRHLVCLRGLVCLTERNYAPVWPLGEPGYEGAVEMTNAYVVLVDGNDAAIRVMLR
ncbi:MAG: hypothetical protein KGK08_04850 [Acidobacteriota bacterium]|nr:hypothetical protein [Acidobacteriota bacterium]